MPLHLLYVPLAVVALYSRQRQWKWFHQIIDRDSVVVVVVVVDESHFIQEPVELIILEWFHEIVDRFYISTIPW